MQRKRDISIYFLPVACEQSPQAVTWPPCKERRGVIGKRGVNFVREGVLGLFLVAAFCANFYQHDQEYIVKGDVFCSFDYLSWDGA